MQRADEVAKIEPKVAYYCRMYAVEQASPWYCNMSISTCIIISVE